MTVPLTSIDPRYVGARRVLLDALVALAEHRDAVILAGAQAIYLQTDDAVLDASVAPFTQDADLTIDPAQLGPDPQIVAAMRQANFHLKIKNGGGEEPGTWLTTIVVDGQPQVVPVDLLVPDALAVGNGKRDARLPDHGRHATRRTPGLEAAILDHTTMEITSLEPEVDTRHAHIRVAGVAALLVAKAHKITDRLADADLGRLDRVKPKDAGDVVRLMRSRQSVATIGARLAEMSHHPTLGDSVSGGVQRLAVLFSRPRTRGVDLAVDALATALTENDIRALAPAYINVLLAAYRQAGGRWQS